MSLKSLVYLTSFLSSGIIFPAYVDDFLFSLTKSELNVGHFQKRCKRQALV